MVHREGDIDMEQIEEAVLYSEWLCRDANAGYDQANRWDFPPKPQIVDGKCVGDTAYAAETDCSSLVYTVLKWAGYLVPPINFYTGNEISILTGIGFKKIAFVESEGKNQLLVGDILYKSGHTAIWTGSAIAEAYGDENGNAKYGQAGDQLNDTDHGETRLSPYRGGWTYILRAPEPEKDLHWVRQDGNCEFGGNGVPRAFEQDKYTYEYEKYDDGRLIIRLSDYFNGGTGKSYKYGYFLDKPLEFPSKGDDKAPKFVDIPHVWIQCRAYTNLLNGHIHDMDTEQALVWFYAPHPTIPRFWVDVKLEGHWK